MKNRFTRVVFGVNNSPAQLNGTVRKHADKYAAADPHFTTTVIDSFFVDDFTGGDEDKQSTLTLYRILKLRFL